MKKTKYKLYTAQEDGKTLTEFYSKKDLDRFKYEDSDTLFECAERMAYKFNRGVKDGEQKRYAYKLEKVTVEVLGKEEYYGMNISSQMYEPEFK